MNKGMWEIENTRLIQFGILQPKIGGHFCTSLTLKILIHKETSNAKETLNFIMPLYPH